MNRRGQLIAVAACLSGAALALFAVTRVWSIAVEQRAGLPELRTEQTGAAAQPWLIGIALVALAGAGALLATRGAARRALGVLLTAAGAGIVVGAVVARAGLDAGEAGAAAVAWPAACVLGGAAITLGGLLAARHGHLWSAMSSRYDRTTVPPAADPVAGGTGPVDPPVRSPERPADTRAFWEALDRGEDPTR